MSRQSPYLQRRGLSLTFRIGVPHDLRARVGAREITKALGTTNRDQASSIALNLAGDAKRLFCKLRAQMMGKKTLDEFLTQDFTLRIDLGNDGLPQAVTVQAEPAEKDAAVAAAKEVLAGISQERQKAALGGRSHPVTPETPQRVLSSPSGCPTLKTVIDGFLRDYAKKNKSAMLKKHQPVLAMFLEVVGNKPVNELKQADINGFFDLLLCLPPRWAAECNKKNLTIKQLAAQEHAITIGPKTFDGTYISCIRPFLVAAKRNWQDQGFPLGLTVDGLEYVGDREKGEKKQRAFTESELKRLFIGDEMKSFSIDPNKAHFYWLPHLGLFTGARVNEICQINPQTDIVKDDDSGYWYLDITTKTPSDDRIVKSVKTGFIRKIPIHKKLIDLGFLKYVEHVQKAGAKLLFPNWTPINNRASTDAEKWFRKFLVDQNLRDETPGKCILGMHAFRSTLLTYGAKQTPTLVLFGITGHAQDDLPIPASGAGKGYLTTDIITPLKDKAEILDKLDYGLDFHKATHAFKQISTE